MYTNLKAKARQDHAKSVKEERSGSSFADPRLSCGCPQENVVVHVPPLPLILHCGSHCKNKV